jgi:pimeloyl-ACP methyl ester carboxylesterase
MRLAAFASMAAVLVCLGGAAEAAVAERSCHIKGFETPVRCVTVDVPRDYDQPGAGALKITAVIIPASTGRPAPDPVVVLAGGPGQAASMLAGPLAPLISEARKSRDVVLFDLRGIGLSEPLNCPGMEQFGMLSDPAASDMLAYMDAYARRCLALHGERARNHTSREAVEDLERFREAMGYPALNLWGGSFGTRIAQHYVRAYGQHTRSVVLDAAAPVGLSVLASGGKSPDRTIETILAACEKTASCAGRFHTPHRPCRHPRPGRRRPRHRHRPRSAHRPKRPLLAPPARHRQCDPRRALFEDYHRTYPLRHHSGGEGQLDAASRHHERRHG